jgi:hypothetical protein
MLIAWNRPPFVPAEAGTQGNKALDSHLRGNERGVWHRSGAKN